MIRRRITTAILALVCTSGAAVVAQQTPAGTDTAAQLATARGYSQPSERRTQAFESAGVIWEVLVKEGDLVKAGQILMKQDDRMDRQELEVRRIDAESTVEVDSAQKEFDLRQIQYERKSGAETGFSKTEIEEALITMQLAELKVAEAKQKNTQAKAVYERQRVKTELMTLPSKIEGVVEKITVDAGEMADPQKPEGTISIVKNNPLWVEVPLLQTWQAARLKHGQELEVRYEIDNKPEWRKAKVIYIAPVADARSGTQSVRLEMPNPENRSAGLDVQVKLPAELTNDPTAGGVTGN